MLRSEDNFMELVLSSHLSLGTRDGRNWGTWGSPFCQSLKSSENRNLISVNICVLACRALSVMSSGLQTCLPEKGLSCLSFGISQAVFWYPTRFQTASPSGIEKGRLQLAVSCPKAIYWIIHLSHATFKCRCSIWIWILLSIDLAAATECFRLP